MTRRLALSCLQWLMLLGVSLLVLPMWARAGTVCGTVRDAAGYGPVAGAAVILRHSAGSYTGWFAATDATGGFCVSDVPPGTYDLEVRHDDFLVAFRRGVTVIDDENGVDLIVEEPPGLCIRFPNPAVGEVTLSFRLPAPGSAHLTVYDVRGRLIHGWEAAFLPAGDHAQPWSMLDLEGRRVPPGLYFVRLTSGSLRQARTMIYLHP